MPWSQLPGDVQLLILQTIADSAPRERHEPSHHAGQICLALCAAVCREWQDFFEAKLFRRLTLQLTCLDRFDRVVASDRRRALVRKIWFWVELWAYDCSNCPAGLEPNVHSAMFKLSVSRLLYSLSRWTDSPSSSGSDTGTTGLSLEISAWSRSDDQHIFQGNVYLDAEDFTHQESDDVRRELALRPRGSPEQEALDDSHGWQRGRRTRPVTLQDLLPIRDLRGGSAMQYFEVHVVRELIFRRQTRHSMTRHVFSAFLQCFPRVETLRWEPWRSTYWMYREYITDDVYQSRMALLPPPSLKTLIMFEDFNEDFDLAFGGSRVPCPKAAVALAERSIWLEEFSAAYLVDAQDFFAATIPPRRTFAKWHKLRSLALTSRLLDNRSHADKVFAMLMNASSAALRMPALRLMEIWFAKRHTACVFRYRVSGGRASIFWRGTWLLSMRPKLVQAWQKVARFHTELDMVVEETQMIFKVFRSHASAIFQLGLHAQVAHPASLEEIWRESDRYSYKVGIENV